MAIKQSIKNPNDAHIAELTNGFNVSKNGKPVGNIVTDLKYYRKDKKNE